MARTRKTPGGETPVSPPATPAAARSALSLEDATKVGFFGVEVDQTDDATYAAPGAGEGHKLTPPNDSKEI